MVIIATTSTAAITGLTRSRAPRNPVMVSAAWTGLMMPLRACPGPDIPARWAMLSLS